ncbi:MAG: lysophospholipid acyltransferase family protein [Myxococcaceae bacterium]
MVVASVTYVFSTPFDKHRHAMHWLIAHWGFQYIRVWPGWRVKVLNREKIPKAPVVFVANHQSMADVISVLGIYAPYKFVSKAELFRIPILGWLMSMAKYVPVERGKPHSMNRMIEECRGWLRAGVSVLIFPEGTYSGGKKMLPFKRGAFTLACDEQVPVVPVVLKGTPELIHEDGPWMSPRANISVEVLDTIAPFPKGREDELSKKVRAVLAEKLGQNPVEPPATTTEA